MTEIQIQIRPGQGQSLADVARALVWGERSRWLLPARTLQGNEGEERLDPSHGLSTFEGPSLAPRVVQAAQQGDSTDFVCALCIRLPSVDGLRPHTYLRHRFSEQMVPLCALQVESEQLLLHFGALPMFAPPEPHSEWPGAVAEFRTQLSGLLHALLAVGVQVHMQADLRPWALDRLAEDLGLPLGTAQPPKALPCTPSRTPGPCLGCRHANQGTIDLTEDRLLACTLAGSKFGQTQPVCDVKLKPSGYAYEPWDGANCTWGAGVKLDFG